MGELFNHIFASHLEHVAQFFNATFDRLKRLVKDLHEVNSVPFQNGDMILHILIEFLIQSRLPQHILYLVLLVLLNYPPLLVLNFHTA